jgi:putative hydrolase of the HAD superfamily
VTNWRAIVFDLDDTLYPERDYVLSGFRSVATWACETLVLDAEQCFSELTYLFEKGVRGNTFDLWLNANNLDPQLTSELVSVYRNHVPRIALPDNVKALLQSIRSVVEPKRPKLGIITDGFARAQLQKVRALQLEDYFDYILLTDLLGREYWKPHPRPFLEMKQWLGTSDRCVYIGDNPRKDFWGANSVGYSTIRVTYMNGDHAAYIPETSNDVADWVATSVTELSSLLLD